MQQDAQLAGELPWEGEESVRNTAPRSAMTDGQETEAGKLRGRLFWFVSCGGICSYFYSERLFGGSFGSMDTHVPLTEE